MKTCYPLLLAVTFLSPTSALCQGTNAVQDADPRVTLTIACRNSLVVLATNVSVSVCITNGSTNAVVVGQPICDFQLYAAWLTDAMGYPTDIGIKRKGNGPGASAGGMNVNWILYPDRSIDCVMQVPLENRIKPGNYTLVVARWCTIFNLAPDGKLTPQARRLLFSNPLPLELMR